MRQSPQRRGLQFGRAWSPPWSGSRGIRGSASGDGHVRTCDGDDRQIAGRRAPVECCSGGPEWGPLRADQETPGGPAPAPPRFPLPAGRRGLSRFRDSGRENGAGIAQTPESPAGQEIPRPPNRRGPRRSRPNRESGIPCFPIPAESGIGDSLPVSRPNRESGERELGIFGSARDPDSRSRPRTSGNGGFPVSRLTPRFPIPAESGIGVRESY
jgi:hypothetical protein